MENKYMYCFCEGEDYVEQTGIKERSEVETKKIKASNWSYRRILETRIVFFFFLFLAFSLIFCVLVLSMWGALKPKDSFKDIFNNDKSKLTLYQKNFEALPNNLAVHERRLRNKAAELISECTFLSILDLTKIFYRQFTDFFFINFYDYVVRTSKHYYNRFLNLVSKRRKEVILEAHLWFEELIKVIIEKKGISDINPNANNKYKNYWTDIVIKQSEDTFEASKYMLLLLSLNEFANFLSKKNDLYGVSTAIQNIVKTKSFESWLPKEELEKHQKLQDVISGKDMTDFYTELALDHWKTLLLAMSPLSVKSSLDEKIKTTLKNLWIYTVSSSRGVIFDDLSRIDHCIIAYGKYLRIYEKKFEKENNFKLVDVDGISKAKSWVDIQKIAQEKTINSIKNHLTSQDVFSM